MKVSAMPSPNVLNVHSLAISGGRGLGRAHQATYLERLRKIAQIVLERIRDAGFLQVDPALANALVYILAQHVVDELVEIWIVREDDVPAFIPDKSLGIDMRRGVSADIVRLFVERPVGVAKFVQTISCTQTGWTASDDHHFLICHAFLGCPSQSA
jgi:hypothetical protein